jgi:hypothetical protein
MTKRWWFKQQKDERRWTWRSLRGDGTIEQQGGDFQSYGTAVIDAIHKGFRPKEDHWVIDTGHDVTHYEQGKQPIMTPKIDRAMPPDLGKKIERYSGQQEPLSTATRRSKQDQ